MNDNPTTLVQKQTQSNLLRAVSFSALKMRNPILPIRSHKQFCSNMSGASLMMGGGKQILVGGRLLKSGLDVPSQRSKSHLLGMPPCGVRNMSRRDALQWSGTGWGKEGTRSSSSSGEESCDCDLILLPVGAASSAKLSERFSVEATAGSSLSLSLRSVMFPRAEISNKYLLSPQGRIK